jgi:hypothetical protein
MLILAPMLNMFCALWVADRAAETTECRTARRLSCIRYAISELQRSDDLRAVLFPIHSGTTSWTRRFALIETPDIESRTSLISMMISAM